MNFKIKLLSQQEIEDLEKSMKSSDSPLEKDKKRLPIHKQNFDVIHIMEPK